VDVIAEILIGWCTIHGLIYFSLAVLIVSIVLYISHVRWERRAWSPRRGPLHARTQHK
jgi:hypothetical protein